MELSLEKIELVKDRTGVSYREAKDALIKADGSVVDAIILLEDEIDISPKTAAAVTASDIVSKIGELVHKGNVERIVVKKDDDTILNIPVSAGIIGTFILPEAAVISTIAALGAKCSISIVDGEGSEIDIIKKVSDGISSVRENYSGVADEVSEKGSSAFSKIREKADSVISKIVPSEDDEMEDDYFNFDDEYPDVDEEISDESEENIQTAEEEPADTEVKTAAEGEAEVKKAAQEASDAVDEAEEAVHSAEDVSDSSAALDEAGEKFESTINSYREKKDKFF
ncbi:MAG: DUF4342 domain-containing protein [Eubacteriales bacterium]|nr:DUF4342 domain-containing protein [Eubacteriales bacterium]